MEVRSLYREPERREQIAFGALEFHDVFKIFRSGPAETVALRGLDLRIEPRRAGRAVRAVGLGQEHGARTWRPALDEPSAGEVRAFGRSLSRLDEAELARLPGARGRDRLPERESVAGADARARTSRSRCGSPAGAGTSRARPTRALDAFGLQPARAPARRRRSPAASSSGSRSRRRRRARRRSCSPTSRPAELDARNEQIVLDALRRLRDEFGSTVVVVTHSPRVADAADRVIEIRDGAVA